MLSHAEVAVCFTSFRPATLGCKEDQNTQKKPGWRSASLRSDPPTPNRRGKQNKQGNAGVAVCFAQKGSDPPP